MLRSAEQNVLAKRTSVVMIVVFTVAALGIIAWMFKSGYRLRK